MTDREYAKQKTQEWLQKAMVELATRGGTAHFFECVSQTLKWQETARRQP